MRSQGIEGLTRTKIGKPHRWFANFRVMEAVAPLAVNHPYLGLQAIIFEDYGEVGTDTVAGITNALPEGRIKDLFRQPLRPSHPSWMDAQYTITMADSRVTHWEQHLAPYRDRVQRVLEIGCYEGQSVRMLTVTCVDPWTQKGLGKIGRARVIERRFDANLVASSRQARPQVQGDFQ